ncbi:MAG: riboflavin synthase [Pseudomonadota bacterium]
MFTGIVTDIGTVKSVEEINQGRRFEIATNWNIDDLEIGASVSNAGTCLTVTDKTDHTFSVEAWEEALRLTTLGKLKTGDRINLERSLKIGDELGGHLVTGHVDGTARIVSIEPEGDATRFVLEAPEALARFIAGKGSVCLDGTSLTVNGVDGNRFDVLLIRHSLEVTTWGQREPGDLVNLEVDIMARYAARLAQFEK